MIKASTTAGSAYAAIMITGSHGVRMQYNYTHDLAGPSATVSAASPLWLRLTRTGDAITGSESSDGIRWTKVGIVHITGLEARGQGGVFAASPAHSR